MIVHLIRRQKKPLEFPLAAFLYPVTQIIYLLLGAHTAPNYVQPNRQPIFFSDLVLKTLNLFVHELNYFACFHTNHHDHGVRRELIRKTLCPPSKFMAFY